VSWLVDDGLCGSLAVGWQEWVSLVVIDVLFSGELRYVAVGWLVWVSLLAGGILFKSVCIVCVVE
jgi:hypothetical protein